MSYAVSPFLFFIKSFAQLVSNNLTTGIFSNMIALCKSVSAAFVNRFLPMTLFFPNHNLCLKQLGGSQNNVSLYGDTLYSPYYFP